MHNHECMRALLLLNAGCRLLHVDMSTFQCMHASTGLHKCINKEHLHASRMGHGKPGIGRGTQ